MVKIRVNMIDSRDVFGSETERRVSDRFSLRLVLLVLAANALIVLSLLFDFQWWLTYPITGLVFCLVYIFTFLTYKFQSEKYSKLFNEGIRRFEDWRDYYESKFFIRSLYDYKYPPVTNGDYFLFFRGEEEVEYMRYESDIKLIGRDIDSNNHYSIELRLCNIINGNTMYSQKGSDVDLSRFLYDLMKQAQEDGYRIVSVYNKYGDEKWSQSDNPKKPSKARKCIFNVVTTCWYILVFVVIFLPMVFMYKSCGGFREDY